MSPAYIFVFDMSLLISGCSFLKIYCLNLTKNKFKFVSPQSGGPGVVVSTPAFHARVWVSFPGPGGLKKKKMFLPHPLVKLSIVRSLRDLEVACSASDLQGLNLESRVWRAVSSHNNLKITPRDMNSSTIVKYNYFSYYFPTTLTVSKFIMVK